MKHGRVLVAREVLSSAEQSSATIQDSHEVLSSTPHRQRCCRVVSCWKERMCNMLGSDDACIVWFHASADQLHRL